MTRSQIRKYAFIKSIPIMCSYIFVSMAYGIMMEDAGFKWYYSLLVSLTVYTGAFQFELIAFFSRCYWMIGSVLGGMLGQLIPWDMEGIDFCMTALFVIIFIDQWEKADRHTPALAGLGIGIICLIIFGASGFMLPALLLTSGLLVVLQKRKEEV